jgi:hypothetical protein
MQRNKIFACTHAGVIFFSRLSPTSFSMQMCTSRLWEKQIKARAAYERNKSKPRPTFACEAVAVINLMRPNDPAATHPDPYLHPSYCLYKKGRRQAEERGRTRRREKNDGTWLRSSTARGVRTPQVAAPAYMQANHASLLCKPRRSRPSVWNWSVIHILPLTILLW